jgi:hypothetical protein
VFDGISSRCNDGRGLEMMDLDGDSCPELILTPTYKAFDDPKLPPIMAEIWKWSVSKKTYVLHKRMPYQNRLQKY